MMYVLIHLQDSMEALRQRHVDTSRSPFSSSSSSSFSLTKIWTMSRGDTTDSNEATDSPISVICEIAETALTCLQSWLHPVGFSILLANLVGDLCFLLVSVVRELALDSLKRMILAETVSVSSSSPDHSTDSAHDSYRCGWSDQCARHFRADVACIEGLFLSFCGSAEVVREVAKVQHNSTEARVFSQE
jgi:hypothetical protein